jgi:dihydrofolate synthase/folylpolyglutamate synthase
MLTIQKQSAKAAALGKQRSYGDIVELLDRNWSIVRTAERFELLKKLDLELGGLTNRTPAIIVGGTNGKSLTIAFAAKLLAREGYTVAALYAPHILTYNERIAFGDEIVSNKVFTELGNEILNTAETLGIELHSSELLFFMGLVHARTHTADVILIETIYNDSLDPAALCAARIATITRITGEEASETDQVSVERIAGFLSIVHSGTHIVSGDQSKTTLAHLRAETERRGGIWEMPIRKLAALPYPFEQLHGRSAELATRIAQLFIEQCTPHKTPLAESILAKPKGPRGRPTIDKRRERDLNPPKTIEQFWRETVIALPGKFQLLDKEKPTILLDTARNLDAIKNLLLGVRLLHYQRPLKGLTIIMAATRGECESEEFLKLLRYFFKKTSGQILLCPISEPLAGNNEQLSWNAEEVANSLKNMKVKARACTDFAEAFDVARKSVDERNGLVVITGSQSIVHEYWSHKGIKKFA